MSKVADGEEDVEDAAITSEDATNSELLQVKLAAYMATVPPRSVTTTFLKETMKVTLHLHDRRI